MRFFNILFLSESFEKNQSLKIENNPQRHFLRLWRELTPALSPVPNPRNKSKLTMGDKDGGKYFIIHCII
jgi:hypothetical protein